MVSSVLLVNAGDCGAVSRKLQRFGGSKQCVALWRPKVLLKTCCFMAMMSLAMAATAPTAGYGRLVVGLVASAAWSCTAQLPLAMLACVTCATPGALVTPLTPPLA